MIGKLFHFIFVLFILALLIGVPAGWMITRSYSNPEVHYFYAQKAPEEGTDQEKGEEALRFIVLSDLYNYVFEGGNGEIADQAANTSPDAILICGNMISADAENTDVITSLINPRILLGKRSKRKARSSSMRSLRTSQFMVSVRGSAECTIKPMK